MGIAEETLNLIIKGAKPVLKAAKGATKGKAPRAALPPRKQAKQRTSDEEIEKILSEAGLTRADLAREYPQVAPGVPSVDAKTGKAYIAKGVSAEAEAVARARKLIQDDIKRGDYDPFFDVQARYPANASMYDRPDLTRDLVPSRADTVAKYNELYAGPASQERLTTAIDRAIGDPMAHGFYDVGQLEDAYIATHGPELGRQLFQERFADSMAATTGGADPTGNLLMAMYGNYLKQARSGADEIGIGHNRPPPQIPRGAYDMPYPIGGRYASGNMAMYDKMIGIDDAGRGVTAANPKRYDFSTSYLGYTDRPVIDEQMMKAIDPTSTGAPAKGAYGVARRAVEEAAASRDLTPIGGQEVGWAGVKEVGGKPTMAHINEMLWRTSRLTGETQQQVLDRMTKSKGPLYGLTAAAPIGLMALSPEEAQAAQATQPRRAGPR
jgi:hypothetical protein